MADISRRQLFRLRPSTIIKACSEKKVEKVKVEPKHIRPPGALKQPVEFNRACQDNCQSCAEACPHGAISFLGPEFGRGEGTPVLSPKDNPCRWCEGFPCIKACPTEALQQSENQQPAPIAKVGINVSKCSNSYGELCDTCVLTCPTSIRALRLVNGRVELNETSCTGCGLCAYYCSEHNDAISIKHIS
jgi:ferredoxin-type protein NapG